MSNYFRGLVTFGSTGLVTPNVGFQPVGYKLTYGQKFGITDTTNHVSVGGSDGTRQHVVGHFEDGTGRQTWTLAGKVVHHCERVGGVITPVIEASHDSMQPLGPRINVTNPDVNYQAVLEAWD